jgi:hypothetical protein
VPGDGLWVIAGGSIVGDLKNERLKSARTSDATVGARVGMGPFRIWDVDNSASGTTVNSESVVGGYAFTGVEDTSLVTPETLKISVCPSADVVAELLANARSPFEPESESSFFEPSTAEYAGAAANMNKTARNVVVCLPLVMLIWICFDGSTSRLEPCTACSPLLEMTS